MSLGPKPPMRCSADKVTFSYRDVEDLLAERGLDVSN
jgi:hypothetical protein